MTIVQWADSDFTNETLKSQATDRGYKKHKVHRTRQSLFYQACARFLNQQNRTWKSFHDVDEFLTINSAVLNGSNELIKHPGSILNLVHKYSRPPPNNNTNDDNYTPAPTSAGPSFWYSHFSQNPCIEIGRVLYSAVESTNAEISLNVPLFVKARQFDTLRFRYRAAKRWWNDGQGKSIIDVSRIQPHDYGDTDIGSAHRPLKRICTNSWVGYNQLPLGIHHYLGSWESYSFRNDARRGSMRNRNTWEKKAVQQRGGPDDEVRPWMQGFVTMVGAPEAQRLLQDAGLPPDSAAASTD
jgi:hypothetical protein